jgi:ribosomal protein S30
MAREKGSKWKQKISGHGGITKSGKVRSQTPKVPRHERTSPGPRMRWHRKTHMLELHERYPRDERWP